MEFEPKDQEVVDLLVKVKNTNGGYPPEMLASRRQTYLNQMAGMGFGTGIGTAIKNVAKNGGGASFTPPSAGALLEVALVVAIVAEAGVLAYFNRDKVVDIFRSVSTDANVQDVASPPGVTSPFPDLEISGSPITVNFTGTASEMPTGTPVPGITANQTINNDGDATLPANSTPIPNEENGNNGNNGNHYGQTPRPQRTKENNRPPNDNPGNGNH